MSVVGRVLEGRRVTQLLGARIVEQGVLGLSSLVLAASLGPVDFAAVSLLFVVNSLAVNLSDFGVGIAALSGGPGSVSTGTVRTLRWVDFSIAGLGVVVGLSVGGTIGMVVATSSMLWAVSAEAYVRKSLCITVGGTATVARLEIVGSLVFGLSVVVALVHPGAAIEFVAVGFLMKQVIECWTGSRFRAALAVGPGRFREPVRIWSSQAASTLTANADYLVVGVVFGAAAFSLYSVAFRLTSLIPSQVSAAAQRVVLHELGATRPAELRARSYRRRLSQLFVVGLAAALAMAVAGSAIVPLLGSEWEPTSAMIVVLAVAIPWRNLGALGGAAILGEGRSRHLLGFEVTRLAAAGLIYIIAASVGLSTLVAAVAVVAIASACAVHLMATQGSEFRPPVWFWYSSVGAAATAIVSGALLSRSISSAVMT